MRVQEDEMCDLGRLLKWLVGVKTREEGPTELFGSPLARIHEGELLHWGLLLDPRAGSGG